MTDTKVRFSPGVFEDAGADANARTVSAILNTEDVALDGHIVRTAGLDTESFMRNPVIPFCHQTDAPPVGRMISITRAGTVLRGTMEFADAETYPFADTIYRLVKGRFLNATSIGWAPIEWERMNDRKNLNGLIFTKSQLLEVSIVPVPANPDALITARAAGIDTGPIFTWAERALDTAGYAAVPRDELEQIRKAAKMPKPSRAVAANSADPASPVERANPRPNFKRGLWTVSWLACLLEDLSIVQEATEWEASAEGDGSPIPGRLLEAVKSLGAILVDMTAEEVAELLGGDEGPGDIDEAVDRARSLRSLARCNGHVLRHFVRAADEVASGMMVTIQTREAPLALHRVGKAISAENERCLREALTHHDEVARCIKRVLPPDEESGEPGPDNEDTERAARELRERKARAAAARVKLAPV